MTEQLVELAKIWPGHSGVNYETTTDANLIALIADAAKGDRKELLELRAASKQRTHPGGSH